MTKESKLKLFFINLAIFLMLVILIETFTMFIRYVGDREFIGWMYSSTNSELNDSCLQMETHPFLSHAHKHDYNCDISFGEVNGQFIDYKYNKEKNYNITVTLGGSTTTGFYENIHNGYSWPYFLHKMITENGERVSNGGVGGYSVIQEMLKILTEVPRIDGNITRIISLSGINDIESYQSSNQYFSKIQPFMTNVQMEMLINQYWVSQDKPKFIYRILPNTKRLITFLSTKLFGQIDPNKAKKPNKKYDNLTSNNLMKKYKDFDHIDRWHFGISLSNTIAKSYGANYYNFLQPTMGLYGVQSENANPNSRDSEILKVLLDKKNNYISQLNMVYNRMREICNSLDFCYDISDIAPPIGNNYHDPRHHNKFGNEIIANEIFSIITKEKEL